MSTTFSPMTKKAFHLLRGAIFLAALGLAFSASPASAQTYSVFTASSPAAGGTAYASPTTATNGQAVTIWVANNPDWAFTHFSVFGGTLVSSSNTAPNIVIVSGTGPVIVTAYFVSTAPKYNLTMVAGVGGTTSPTGTVTGLSKDWFNILATPSAGYLFDSWTGAAGVENAAAASTRIYMDADKTVTANFKPLLRYTGYDPSGPGTAAFVTNLTLGQSFTASPTTPTVIVSADHRRPCVGWVQGAGDIPASGSYSYYGPFPVSTASSNRWVWTNEYLVVVNASTGANVVDYLGSNWWVQGRSVTLSASPLPGYLFTGWRVGSSNVAGTLNLTVTGPVNITANFSLIGGDSDGDALPDSWEQRFNLDPLNGSGNDGPDGDPDRDGLSNYEEFTIQATNRNWYANPLNADTDSDGMDDQYERYFIDPTNLTVEAARTFISAVLDSGVVNINNGTNGNPDADCKWSTTTGYRLTNDKLRNGEEWRGPDDIDPCTYLVVNLGHPDYPFSTSRGPVKIKVPNPLDTDDQSRSNSRDSDEDGFDDGYEYTWDKWQRANAGTNEVFIYGVSNTVIYTITNTVPAWDGATNTTRRYNPNRIHSDIAGTDPSPDRDVLYDYLTGGVSAYWYSDIMEYNASSSNAFSSGTVGAPHSIRRDQTPTPDDPPRCSHPFLMDFDRDGLPDGYEVIFGYDPWTPVTPGSVPSDEKDNRDDDWMAKQSADDLDVLRHAEVYALEDFDPRTAWGATYPGPGDMPGAGANATPNTAPYTAREELWGPDGLMMLVPKGMSTVVDNASHPLKPDTDGDGIWDGWEAYMALNPANPLDGSLDADGDGLSNYEEFYSFVTSSTNRLALSPVTNWLNKIFPTDIHNGNTDDDDLGDDAERTAFQGGLATDVTNDVSIAVQVGTNTVYVMTQQVFTAFTWNGACYTAGGLNPTSWDTDGDTLPDPWEAAFPGGANGTLGDTFADTDDDKLPNYLEYMTAATYHWQYDRWENGKPSYNTRDFFERTAKEWDWRATDCDEAARYIPHLTPGGAIPYSSTDPGNPDSDMDGMDDYWEIYHGLCPVYGYYSLPASRFTEDMVIIPNPFVAPWVVGDPRSLPWAIGTPESDPDGDGLHNGGEAVDYRNEDYSPTYHTDPSPLWLTDPSYSRSYVNLYYVPGTYWPNAWATFPFPDERPTYMYDFEMNEGFDTDNDNIGDYQELNGTFTDALSTESPIKRRALYLPPGRDAYVRTDTPYHFLTDTFRSFTVEAWVKPANPASGQRQIVVERPLLVAAGNPLGGESLRINFRLALDEAGVPYVEYTGDGDPVIFYQAKAASMLPLSDKNWTHLAGTYSVPIPGEARGRLTLYVNGQMAQSITPNELPAVGRFGNEGNVRLSSAPFVIGAGDQRPNGTVIPRMFVPSPSPHSFFKGWIDEVRIWHGDRTQGEIAQNMQKRMKQADAVESLSNSNVLYGLFTFDDLPDPDHSPVSPEGYDVVIMNNKPADYLAAMFWAGSSEVSMRYTDYTYVPWIENSAAHIPERPAVDLGDPRRNTDMVYPNQSNPYNFRYFTAPTVDFEINPAASSYVCSSPTGEAWPLFTDLLPLRWAEADEDVEMWDGGGAPAVAPFDSDGDGLPDAWEERYGFDPLDPSDINGADGDYDGDGLTNYNEYRAGTDPTRVYSSNNGAPDGDNDADGDTLPNIVEQDVYGTDPSLPDTDDDGVMDGADWAPDNSLIKTNQLLKFDALSFGGTTNDYVELPVQDRFALSTWRVQAWVRPSSDTTWTNGTILYRSTPSGTNYVLSFNRSAGTSGAVGAGFSGIGYAEKVSSALRPEDYINGWVHLAASYDASTRYLRIYVNNIMRLEQRMSGYPANAKSADAQMRIGSAFKGEIREVAVWSTPEIGGGLTLVESATLSPDSTTTNNANTYYNFNTHVLDPGNYVLKYVGGYWVSYSGWLDPYWYWWGWWGTPQAEYSLGVGTSGTPYADYNATTLGEFSPGTDYQLSGWSSSNLYVFIPLDPDSGRRQNPNNIGSVISYDIYKVVAPPAYDQQLSGEEVGLVGYWRMDDDTYAAKNGLGVWIGTSGSVVTSSPSWKIWAAKGQVEDFVFPRDWENGWAHAGTRRGNVMHVPNVFVPRVDDPDNDGMPTWWELAYGLDPNNASGNSGAGGDPDGDGLYNLYEFRAGTDPYSANTDRQGLGDYDEDGIDHDGISNGDEQDVYNTDPGEKDSDDDGKDDSQEIIEGTEPTDAFSPYIVRALRFNGDAVSNTVVVTDGLNHVSPNRLGAKEWTIETMVYAEPMVGVTNDRPLIQRDIDGTNKWVNYELGLTSNNCPYVRCNIIGLGAIAEVRSQVSLPTTQWLHLAGRFADGKMSLFVDGVVVRTVHFGVSQCERGYGDLILGSPGFKGYIKEARIWRIAREDSDIEEYQRRSIFTGAKSVDARFLRVYGAGMVKENSTTIGSDGNPIDNLQGDWTLEAWVRTTDREDDTHSPRIIARRNGANAEDGYNYSLGLSPQGTISVRHNNWRVWYYYSPYDYYWGWYDSESTGEIPVNDGEWHHVAYVRRGLQIEVYVDGLLDVVDTAGGFTSTLLAYRAPTLYTRPGPVVLGEQMTGDLDEVRIWNRALDREEILSQMGRNLSGAEQGLISYLNFDFNTDAETVNERSSLRDADNEYGVLVGDATNVPQDNATITLDPLLVFQRVALLAYFPADDGGLRLEDVMHREGRYPYDGHLYAGQLDSKVQFVDLPTSSVPTPFSMDNDEDGLPDWWEVQNNLDIDSAAGDDGASGDPDHDGLTNMDEYRSGTNPWNADTDGDGIPDKSEDSDGDALSNLDEVSHYGTNPGDPDTDDDGVGDGAELNPMVVKADGRKFTSPVHSRSPLVQRSMILTGSAYGVPGTIANGPDRLDLNARTNDATWTLEAWVNLRTATETGSIVSRYTDLGQTAYALRVVSNSPVVEFTTTMGRRYAAGANIILGSNTWTHLSGVWDGPANTLQLYVNGVAYQAQQCLEIPASGTGSTRVGEGLAGYLDELRIWDVARTSDEVGSNMRLFGGQFVKGTTNENAASYKGVFFPEGELAFADSVFDYAVDETLENLYADPAKALGVPDSDGMNGNWISLGRSDLATASTGTSYSTGYVCLQFTTTMLKGSGDSRPDLYVFQDLVQGESSYVAISRDGGVWIPVGYASNNISGIDIDAYITSPEDSYRFVLVADTGINPSAAYSGGGRPGPDLDAVGVVGYMKSPLAWYPFDDGENTTVTNLRTRAVTGRGAEDFANPLNWDYAITGVTFTTNVTAALMGEADSDADGMPDWWEALHFSGDALSTNDLDSDGLNNLYEFYCDTNPHDNDSDNNGDWDGVEDCDQDGLENQDEQWHSSDPWLGDTDDDGVGDLAEKLSGTNPSSSQSPQYQRGIILPGTSGNYVEMPTDSRFALKEWTIEAWVCPSTAKASSLIYRQAQPGDPNYFLGFNSGMKPVVGFGTNVLTASSVVVPTGGVMTNVSSWTHIAATYQVNGQYLRVYVNGAEVASMVCPRNPNVGGVGPIIQRIGENFAGAMDEVRIWSVVRGSNDLMETMSEPLGGAEPGLVAYYRFDDGTAYRAGLLGTSRNQAWRHGQVEDFTAGYERDWEQDWRNAASIVGSVTWTNLPYSVPVLIALDSDGDGMPDWWENQYTGCGLDPFSAAGDAGAYGDPDGDGIINLDEYRQGSSPCVADILTITPSVIDVQVGHSTTATVAFIMRTGMSNATVNVFSSDDSLFTVEPALLTFDAATTSAVVTITGVALGEGLGAHDGYLLMVGETGGAQIPVTVYNGVDLTLGMTQAQGDSVVAGDTATMSVSRQRSVGSISEPQEVTLSVADDSLLSVPATVTIPAGSDTFWFPVTGVTVASNVIVKAEAPGYPHADYSVDVVPPTITWYTGGAAVTNILLASGGTQMVQVQRRGNEAAAALNLTISSLSEQLVTVTPAAGNGIAFAAGDTVEWIELTGGNLPSGTHFAHVWLQIGSGLWSERIRVTVHDGLDRDFDGLLNDTETAAGTNPDLADTDGDGIGDYDEDSDGDGISNGEEQDRYGTNPGDTDTDDDGIEDRVELNGSIVKPGGRYLTSPLYSRDPLVPRSAVLTGSALTVPEPLEVMTDGSTKQRFENLERWVVACQVWPAGVETGSLLLRTTDAGRTNFSLRLQANVPVLEFSNLAGNSFRVTAPAALPAGKWSSVMGMWTPTNTTLALYVDEVEVRATNVLSACATGRGQTALGAGITGRVDNLYIGEELFGLKIISQKDFIFVLDVSGSMDGQPLDDQKEAVRAAIDILPEGSEAAIISFSDAALLVQDFTSDRDALKAAVDGLSSQNWTDYSTALQLMLDTFRTRPAGRGRVTIFVSDGQPNGVNDPPSQSLLREISDAGIVINSVGFGMAVWGDHVELDRLAEATGGEYFSAPTGDDLIAMLAVIVERQAETMVYAFYPFDDGSDTAEDYAHLLDWDYAIQGLAFDSTRYPAETTVFNWMFDEAAQPEADDVPAWWIRLFFGTQSFDASGDPDGDGLNNYYEYMVGLNPLSADTDADVTPDGSEDSDGDLLANADEQTHRTDPCRKDSDDDGINDEKELAQQANPLDSTSPLVLRYVRNNGQGWIGVPALVMGKDVFGSRFNLDAWTVEAMVRMSQSPTSEVVVVGRYCEPGLKSFELGVTTGRYAFARFQSRAGVTYEVLGNNQIELNTWVSLAARFGKDIDGVHTKLSIIQDGVEMLRDATDVVPAMGAQRGDLIMGRNLIGDIADVRIWNVARSNQELDALRGMTLLYGTDVANMGALRVAGGSLTISDAVEEAVDAPWTISAWFRTEQDGTILEQRSSGANMYRYRMRITNGVVRAGLSIWASGLVPDPTISNQLVRVPVAGHYEAVGRETVTDGVWHNARLVFDGSRLMLYVDGRYSAGAIFPPNDIGSVQWLGAPADGLGLTVSTPAAGRGDFVVGNGFNGLIDEVQIFDVAQSYLEVRSSYKEQASSSDAVSAFTFDDVAPDDLADGVLFNSINGELGVLLPVANVVTEAGGNAPVKINPLNVLRYKLAAYFPMVDGRWTNNVGAVEDFIHRLDLGYAGSFRPSTSQIDFVPSSNPYTNTIEVSYPVFNDAFTLDSPYRADSDGDGMPDVFEQYFGFDASESSDAVADFDADGLNNLYEFFCGTDPRFNDSDGDGILDGDEDRDGDGLENAVEQAHQSDPRLLDTDDDGVEDLAEVIAGTNPANSRSWKDQNYKNHQRAILLPGTAGSYVTMPLDSRFALEEWTLEAWVCPSTNKAGSVVYRQTQPGNTNYFLGFNAGMNPVAGFGTNMLTASSTVVPYGGAITNASNWTHIAATYQVDGKHLRLYVNGAEVTNMVCARNPNADGAGPIVQRMGENFAGAMDKVLIWSVVRGSNDLMETMSGSLSGAEQGLVACYRFDDGTSFRSGVTGTSKNPAWTQGQVEDFAVNYRRDWEKDWRNAASITGSVTWTNLPHSIPLLVVRDSDGDGQPDWWEEVYGLDPSAPESGADADVDGDGLNNLYEFLAGTDPTVADTDKDGMGDYDEDSDNDTISNGNEQDVSLSDAGSADTDDDGKNDGLELTEVTDPANSLTPFVTRVLEFTGSNVLQNTVVIKDKVNNRFTERHSMSEWTVEAYVNPASIVTGDCPVLSRRTFDTGKRNYELGFRNGAPYVAFDTMEPGTNRVLALSTNSFPPATNKWVHIAGRFTLGGEGHENELALFVDGVCARKLRTGWQTAAGPGDVVLGSPAFRGRMSNVRLWKIPQTDEAIEGQRNNSLLVGSVGAMAGRLSLTGSGHLKETATTIMPNGSSVDMLRDNWTLECWVKTTDSGRLILRRNNSARTEDDFNYYLGIAEDGTLLGRFNLAYGVWVNPPGLGDEHFEVGETPDMNNIKGEIPVNDGQWHHVAYVRDANSCYLYVDGLLDTKQARLLIPYIQDLVLSEDNYYVIKATEGPVIFGEDLAGEMDEIRIWNRALDATELIRLAHRNLSGEEMGLVSYFNFDFQVGVTADERSAMRDPTMEYGVYIPDATRLIGAADGAPITYDPLLAVRGVALKGLFPCMDGGVTLEDVVYRFGTKPFRPFIEYAGTLGTSVRFLTVSSDAFPYPPDSDGDGLPDWWEQQYGLDPADGDSAMQDPDGDGLSNLYEYRAGTNPYEADTDGDGFLDYDSRTGPGYRTFGELWDDGDGIADEWEVRFRGPCPATGIRGLDPAYYDADLDPDRDGWSNYAEFMSDTDPLLDSSHPEPIVAMHFRYSGILGPDIDRALAGTGAGGESNQLAAAKAIVMNFYTTPSMDGHPDASMQVRSGVTNLTVFDVGWIREGNNYIFAYLDDDGDGEWNPVNEPAGIGQFQPVNMGWGAIHNVEIGLTDTMPGYPRFAWEANPGVALHNVTNAVTGGFQRNVRGPRNYWHEGDWLSVGRFGSPTGALVFLISTNVTLADYMTNTVILMPSVTLATPSISTDHDTVFVYARNELEFIRDTNATAYRLQIATATNLAPIVTVSNIVPYMDSLGISKMALPIYAGDNYVPTNGNYASSTWTNGRYWVRLQALTPNTQSAYSPWSAINFNLQAPAPNGTNCTSMISGDIYYFGKVSRGYGAGQTSNLTMIVQAFESPGFSGMPEGQVQLSYSCTQSAYVTNIVYVTNDVGAIVTNTFVTANPPSAKKGDYAIKGLQSKEHYVRAFIDMNGNRALDAFEPMGFARVPATGATAYRPLKVDLSGQASVAMSGIRIVIRDRDTDDDQLPDGWEWMYYGTLARGAYDKGTNTLTLLRNYEIEPYDLDPTLTDYDGDGLEDVFEITYSDGITYAQYLAGIRGNTDHYEPYPPSANSEGTDLNPTLWDTDGDGLSDGYEIMNGLDPLDPNGDADGDGVSDAQEVLVSRTSAASAEDVLKVRQVAAVTPAEGFFSLSWSGKAGVNYQVQYSDDLKIWTDAPDGAVSGAGEHVYVEASPSVNVRYYRVVTR